MHLTGHELLANDHVEKGFGEQACQIESGGGVVNESVFCNSKAANLQEQGFALLHGTPSMHL
jgi:hypothetical protein